MDVGADLVFLVPGEGAAVDHVVESEVGDLVEAAGGHVEADGAVEEKGPELEEGVEGEGGDVGLAPSVASLLHVLLKLDPPVDRLVVMVTVMATEALVVTVTTDGVMERAVTVRAVTVRVVVNVVSTVGAEVGSTMVADKRTMVGGRDIQQTWRSPSTPCCRPRPL